MERAKRWIVPVLLASAGLALWWRWPARPERVASGEPAQAPASDARPSLEPLRDAPREFAPGEETSRRSSLPPEVLAADALEPLELRVVAGPDHAPVRGARVLFEQPSFVTDAEVERLRDEWAPLERILEVHGLTRTTDERGVARLPTPTFAAHVTARLGELFGTLRLAPAEPGPVELVLERDPPIAVRVEDERGAPVAHVQVGLREVPDEGDCARSRTDAKGLAVLRPAEQRRSFGSTSAFVGLAFPLREPVAVHVDLASPPAEPVVLRMPPAGSVEVELVDGNGQLWQRPVDLGIALGPRVLAELGKLQTGANSFGLRVEGGRGVIEPVGLGLELALDVGTEGHGYVEKVVVGPRTAGERIAATIVLSNPRPMLTGRLVTPEERALGPGRVLVRRREQGEIVFGAHADVDAWGNFSCTLDELPTREPERNPSSHAISIEVPTFELEFQDSPSVVWSGSGWTDLFPGYNDLGTVTMTELAPALAGTVRDDSGAPVRGARIELFLDPTDGVRYSGERLEPLQSDAEGRFELRTHLVGARIGIQVEVEGFVPPEPIVVPIGTVGLDVVLQRGGTVVCVFVEAGDVQPNARLERDGVRVFTPLSSGYRKLLLGPVAPGVYTLHYGHPWSDLEGTVEGVVVRAGERTLDPRLLALDVRALVSVVALTVVDAENRPVPGLVVELRRRKWGDFADCHPQREGERVLLWAGPLPLWLRLEAPGFRTLELTDVDSDRRVVLERGRALRVELAGALPALSEGWTIEGRLRRLAESSSTTESVPPFVFDGNVAESSFSRPGRYAFSFHVVERHAGQELNHDDFWDEPQTVLELEDGTDPQLVRIPAPSSALVDAILEYIREND